MTSSRKNSFIKRFLIILLTIGLLLGAGFIIKAYLLDGQETNVMEPIPTDTDNKNESNPVSVELDPEPEPETFTNIRITAAGDIMFHMPQINAGFDASTNSYNFNSVFEDVSPHFTAADLAIANYETTAGGPERAYSGYPTFNSPDETIDAIKYAGIDVLTTTNNHSLDTGSKGLKRTAQVIREKGLSSVGTYETKPDSRILMKDVNGVKVAIIAYTESTNGLGAQYDSDDLHAMINLMEKDLILADIKEAKDSGADLIISYMHWGVEYAAEPNDTQVGLAEMMTEAGVDIILGSHPHVIQKSEFLEVDGKQSFVIYSMGNFISNQREETLGAGFEKTEDGVIVSIDVQLNDQTREIEITNVDYIPTWVYRNKEQGKSTYTYRILPVQDFLNHKDYSESLKNRMQRSLDATVSKMEASLLEKN